MAVNYGLAGAEERWGITFLRLLATVLLMQHTTLLAFFATRALCWLMANLKSTRIPRAFPEKLFSSRLAPKCMGTWGYSSPRADFCIFSCWTLLGSCQPISTPCIDPRSSVAALSSSVLADPPTPHKYLVLFANLLIVQSVLPFGLLFGFTTLLNNTLYFPTN